MDWQDWSVAVQPEWHYRLPCGYYTVMDNHKLLDYKTGLQLQKRELQSQLDKVDGALQLIEQLLEAEKEEASETKAQEQEPQPEV